METTLTYQYRIKDTTIKNVLIGMSSQVNFVWNFTCDVIKKSWSESRKYVDLNLLSSLTKGSSKELDINSQTIQASYEEVVKNTKRFKKQIRKRSRRTKLGWIPFKGQTFKFLGNYSTYNGYKIRYWYHRQLPKGAIVKSGSFSEDSLGRWYLNLVVSFPEYLESSFENDGIGIDLGIKTNVALSNGEKLERENISKNYEVKLAKAQRHRKKRQVKKINAKIKNKRKDWNHKISFELSKKFKYVFVGDTTPTSILSEFNKINRAIYDASWFTFKTYLAYKVVRRQGCYLEVSEKDISSTETCSNCFNRYTDMSLGIREWTCGKCNSIHDRDINAARNHLRFGHETLRLANAS